MKKAMSAALGAVVLGVAGPAAAQVNIGGLQLPAMQNFGVASVYQNVVSAPGDTLAGFGEVTQINGVQISELCSGCELTYHFDGYTVTSLSPSDVSFSGGFVNFYLGFGADNDLNPFTSADSGADIDAVTNGTLFLTLAGHQIDAAGNTFAGVGRNIGTTMPVGFGAGLVDVDLTGSLNGNTAGAGAIANALFNSNGIVGMFGGPADMQLGASFSSAIIPHAGECPGGPACLAGSVDFRANVVPEPQTYALLLAGLGAVGWVARRRRPA
jgi:hypothetical protein